MKSYTVNRPRLDHDGKRTPRGGTVQLSDAAAAPLVALGAVSPAPADAPASDDAASPDADATVAPKPSKPSRATKSAAK